MSVTFTYYEMINVYDIVFAFIHLPIIFLSTEYF